MHEAAVGAGAKQGHSALVRVPTTVRRSSNPAVNSCIRAKKKILSLCAGPNSRASSLFNLFRAAGYEPVNYDTLNGQEFDLADTAIYEAVLRDIAAGEYMACFASPDCSTFSKLLNLPGGPPVLRGNTGRPRYGLTYYANGKPLSVEDKEKVRVHTLVAVRVAEALDLFATRGLPFGYETPEIIEGQHHGKPG